MRQYGLALACLICVACDGGAPFSPTAGSLRAVAVDEAGGTVMATNNPPQLRLKTRPAATPGDPYPVISGLAPLSVSFNLCESTDPEQDPEAPEQGDSITWQFHFGDDGTEPFAPDGTFQPHFEHFCRTQHTYEEPGRYVATASVTDKHLEDQGRDVSALARTTTRVTIEVGGVPEEPTGCPAAPQSSSLWQSQVPVGAASAAEQLAPITIVGDCFCPVTGETLDFFTYRSEVCISAGYGGAVWGVGQPCGCTVGAPD